MNFQVPQFIEVEDKIFGPLTFKQFIYVAGGAGASFIFWAYLPRFIAVLFIAPVAALALSLAFYKVNNRPFIYILESAVRYFLNHKLYIWKKKEKAAEMKVASLKGSPTPNPIAVTAPKLSQSRLRELSWSLDVQEKVK